MSEEPESLEATIQPTGLALWTVTPVKGGSPRGNMGIKSPEILER